MNQDKLKELAKKLKALADRGVGGEARNAKQMLNDLLQKHNTTVEDLLGDESERIFYRTTLNESSAILQRVILSVNPDAKIDTQKQKTQLIIKVFLSERDYKEVEKKFKVFWEAYNADRQLMLSAFFNKHSHYFIPKIKVKEDFFNAGAVPVPYDIKSEVQKAKDKPPVSEQKFTESQGGLKIQMLSYHEKNRVARMMSALSDIYYVGDDFDIHFKELQKK